MEGSEEYKCDICGMVFVNDTELARHQKFVHENNAILMCFGVRYFEFLVVLQVLRTVETV
jgi:hypothetical protein